jgi:predicted transcriptional regulator
VGLLSEAAHGTEASGSLQTAMTNSKVEPLPLTLRPQTCSFTKPTYQRMSDVELKKRLINRIQRTRDSALLREAYRLMGTDAADLEPYKLSKEQQASINKGKEDIKKGRVLSERQANKAMDEWLGK